MFRLLQAWIQKMRYRHTMAQFRDSMAFFGCPVDHLTDEEVEKQLSQIADVIGSLGVTADEAYQGIRLICHGTITDSQLQHFRGTLRSLAEPHRTPRGPSS